MHSRRAFLGSAIAATTANASPDKCVTPASWFEKPMRWAQVVFTEDDPGKVDVRFWLDYFERIHADAACLGGGGYMGVLSPAHRSLPPYNSLG